MKKTNKGKAFKNHSKRRARNELKRRRASNIKRKIRRYTAATRPSSTLRQLPPIPIVAPAVFSILTNKEELLKFFNRIIATIDGGYKVALDLSQISVLEPEALLYLLSRLDYLNERGFGGFISGNTPKSPELKALLACSGFYEYVSTSESLGASEKVLKIERGTNVQPSVAKKVKDFAQKHLGEFKDKKRSCLYPTIIECMANTLNHAYRKSKYGSKWWLMAIRNDSEDTVHFIFLDNGRGIPETVTKKFIIESFKDDSGLILSALKGEFRTRTGLDWRGKGLPKIHSYFNNGDISNLVLVSGKGYYEGTTGIVSNFSEKFHGTLLAWDYTRSN